jgi:hypothetical protein
MFHGRKGGRCLGLTTLPPSCADYLEVWEPEPPWTLGACPGLYRDSFTLPYLTYRLLCFRFILSLLHKVKNTWNRPRLPKLPTHFTRSYKWIENNEWTVTEKYCVGSEHRSTKLLQFTYLYLSLQEHIQHISIITCSDIIIYRKLIFMEAVCNVEDPVAE